VPSPAQSAGGGDDGGGGGGGGVVGGGGGELQFDFVPSAQRVPQEFVGSSSLQ